MLNLLRRDGDSRGLAVRLFAALMEQARRPAFFRRLAVPDTMDGRFDLVALHAWLVLDRIAGQPQLTQALIDEVFLGFDEALRELGTGDVGMNRRLKTMASAFYGRLAAYRAAPTPDKLAAAVLRNVYRGEAGRQAQAEALAAYALAARDCLQRCDVARGELDFGATPLT
jgi:cytochrome b pre-mRNA-processing protein 3